MTENYTVSYSEDALNDLREIYTYIANDNPDIKQEIIYICSMNVK